MSSSSTGIPSGKLATPITSRTGTLSLPKISRRRSEAPSATFGWSKKSPEVAMNTPRRTTRVIRENQEVLARRGKSNECRCQRCVASRLGIKLLSQSADVFWLVIDHREHSTQEEQCAILQSLNVSPERCRCCGELQT